MNLWILASIVIGLLVVAGTVTLAAADNPTQEEVELNCANTDNGCTQESNCGLSNCGATVGKSCGCGR